MLDWLKNINKEYPDFWKEYLSKFDTKANRIIVLNVYSSGNNPVKDVIFSFGTIGISDDKIVISDTCETVIIQYKYLHDNHLPNNFIAESNLTKNTEAKAIQELIEFIENSTIVGFQTHLDVDLINQALEKILCGRLRNEALDIELMHRKLHDVNEKLSLIELFEAYKLPYAEDQSSLENAYNLALIYLKLKVKLGIKL